MQAVQLTVTSEKNGTSRAQIFNPELMGNVKAVGTGVQFVYPDQERPEEPDTFTVASTTLTQLQTSINAASPSGSQVFIGRISSASGFSIAAHNLLDLDGNAIVLPDNTRVWDAYYEVLTTFTSATDAATISLDIATDDVAGLKAATAISTGTTYDATGAPVALIPQGTVATCSEKTTAARNVTYTIAVETVTAGDLIVYLNCVTAL